MIFNTKAFEMLKDFYYGLFYQAWINSYEFRETLDSILWSIGNEYNLTLFYRDRGHYSSFYVIIDGTPEFIMNYIFDIGEKYRLDTKEKLTVFLKKQVIENMKERGFIGA